MDSGDLPLQQARWLFESEDFPPGFPTTAAAHCGGGAAVETCIGYAAEELDKLKGVSFQCLLGLGDSAPSVFNTGAAYPAQDKPQFIFGADPCGLTFSPQYELNLPRDLLGESVFGNTNLSFFDPITPQKASEPTIAANVTTNDNIMVESGNGLLLHSQETDRQVGIDTPETVPVPDTSSTVAATQDNHESTPRRKAKRKKHVPKVLVEGRKPKTPKPQTGTKPKRKYEQRREISSPNVEESTNLGKNVRQDRATAASTSPLGMLEREDMPPRSKRKYTRKNAVRNGSASNPTETVGEGSNPQAPEVAVKEGTPRNKKKYVRKNAVGKSNPTEKFGVVSKSQAVEPTEERSTGDTACKRHGEDLLHKGPTTPPGEATGESADPQGLPKPAKRSCKRKIDFSSEKPGGGQRCTQKPSPVVSRPEARCELMSISFAKGVEVRVQKASTGCPYNFDSSCHEMLRNYSTKLGYPVPAPSTSIPADSKCSNLNANSSEDHVIEKAGTQLMQQNDIAMSRYEVGEASGSQDKHPDPIGSVNNCMNVTEPFYGGLSLYQTFPRSQMADHQETYSEDCHNSAVNINYLASAHSLESGLPDAFGQAGCGLQYKLHNYSPLNEIERPTERSEAASHIPDLVSLLSTRQALPSCVDQHIQNLNKHSIHKEALPASSQVTLKTKKRSKKDSLAKGSDGALVPFNQNQFSPQISGSLETLFNQMLYVDTLAEQLKDLNISKETHKNARARMNALARKQKNNAMVIYTGDNRLVPYDGPFEPMKRRKPRAKVDIDEETSRVFNLLLKDINSEGIDGTDETKAKYWEEQRSIFRGRTDSFIARMHLVQGDRRFSKWKGSVVDSVIGVFLTQNVSDHLSSSAFMSVAAHFPVKRQQKQAWEEGPHSIVINPTVSMPDEETFNWDQMSNQSISDRSSMTLRDPQHEETEVANIESPPGQEKYCESVISSQNSFVSSQNSNSPAVDRKESSSSGSNSQELDTWDGAQVSSLNVGSSFPELLQTDRFGSTMLQEVPSLSDKASSESIQTRRESAEEVKLKGRTPETKTDSRLINHADSGGKGAKDIKDAKRKAKSRRVGDEIKDADWDALRRSAEPNGKKERPKNTMDSVDWEAVRTADVSEIANTIKARGQNNVLAGRIKEFLNKVVSYHGSLDLEWLRDVHPDRAKEYLLSFNGLGLKSVECIRLLTLHHLAFPVDTNVGRIAVRLGWVPLQPLPESLQLHLLEMYPILDTIQKYLWPRLCKLDQKTLYELHYQLITFGKVFCTKAKPNCNACPMRGECRHFASAFASARLSLPGPDEKRVVVNTPQSRPTFTGPVMPDARRSLPPPTIGDHQNHESENRQSGEILQLSTVKRKNCEPIIEEPLSPEPACTQDIEDIEDLFSQPTAQDVEGTFYEDPDEIPTIKLNEIPEITLDVQELAQNIERYITSLNVHDGDMSLDLVAMATEAKYIPPPKLKNISKLRTEHRVYELPDSHPLIQGLDKREVDDPSPYLLSIWAPGEKADSIQPPERTCTCNEEACPSCSSYSEAKRKVIRGTILIPCRTAMRGSFPLNGTYFQVNEVFADHETSKNPIEVPRSLIWNLPRRTVNFGTSVPTIFRGLTTEEIQQCFWRGFVCVRGFDRETRAPVPLSPRLHFPASKMKTKDKNVAADS